MFRKVLIANRGEIAVRVSSTLQQLGIRTVAVYSDADRAAPHVTCADEAYPLPGTTAAETYLRGDRIIDIARTHEVDAIHPGYGFLSENAAFAKACAGAGLTFIGPSPEVIRAMGDKVLAKQQFAEAGVPVVPGWSGAADLPFDDIARAAEGVGYPVLIKAAAGGGGKGMRVVRTPNDLAASLESAAREAKAAFGDARVFVEKLIEQPRHVEIQILGDHHGNVVHLFERECSVQRRHQKIIEESPSPALTSELRERMGAAAVAAAKAIGYTNAGTVEFLLDAHGSFYFLEVNTRLQVEHPVTEMLVGHDLVRAQVLVAAGKPLPFAQDALRPTGHAIECRVYAEDAARGFVPSIGTIEHYHPPTGPNIRVDSGIRRGAEISVHYDPMLAKLIVWGRDRAESLARMAWALDHFVILGVTTNLRFLRKLIEHPAFQAGRLHTGFLEEHPIATENDAPIPEEAWLAAALSASRRSSGHRRPTETDGKTTTGGPWQADRAWRVI